MFEKVIPTIQSFLEVDYAAQRAKYDVKTSDARYAQLADRAQAFFHSVMPYEYGRGKPISEIVQKPESVARYEVVAAIITPRPLFQIRHYHKPTLGEVLAPHMLGQDLFGVCLGDNRSTPDFLALDGMMFFANSDEGWRFIAQWNWWLLPDKWTHAHYGTQLYVHKPGKLVAIQDFLLPTEAASLREIQHPTHVAHKSPR
jgi:hypothetical protein